MEGEERTRRAVLKMEHKLLIAMQLSGILSNTCSQTGKIGIGSTALHHGVDSSPFRTVEFNVLALYP